jgi:glycosyltransferase involved in cell wall biosynthesis
VRLAGFVEDLCAELDRADLFIAPLRIARGVQNKVLEALAYGLPVVATRQALEGIEAEPDVHLAVAEDAAALARAIVDLLRDREGARVMGEAAREHMSNHYRWEQAMAPLGALLRTPVALEMA